MYTINAVLANKGLVRVSIKKHTENEPEFITMDLHLWQAEDFVKNLSTSIKKAAKYPEEVKAARIRELEASIEKQVEELTRLKG